MHLSQQATKVNVSSFTTRSDLLQVREADDFHSELTICGQNTRIVEEQHGKESLICIEKIIHYLPIPGDHRYHTQRRISDTASAMELVNQSPPPPKSSLLPYRRK